MDDQSALNLGMFEAVEETKKKTEAPPTGAPTEPIVVEEDPEPVAGPSNTRRVKYSRFKPNW